MNILFLMADEFRHDIAGFAGNRVAQTPNLDALAKDAMVFENAYTPSPVCIPARQCLATGKYPLHIGCERFGQDIAPNSRTFARWFTEHGYYTVACGKLHHRGPDQMQGWMQRIGAETAVNWPASFASRSQIGRSKWQGAPDVRDAGAGISPLALHDDLAVRGACDFLKMHFGGMYAIPRDTPVLLMLSLQQPHFPLRTTEKLLEYYRDRVPIFWDEKKSGHPLLDEGRLGPDQGIGEADVRHATAAYYGMVEQADARVGQLLSAFEEAGQDLSEWTVVFTSDHGDMLGQHGLWGKRKFYEGSARIPLFVRAPGLAAGRSSMPCNLVDLFPTLTRLARLPDAAGLDGHDLFDPAHPDETFCQHNQNQFMIRRGSMKYLRFNDAEDVMFDLEADPGETRNVAADSRYAQSARELKNALERFLAAACEATGGER